MALSFELTDGIAKHHDLDRNANLVGSLSTDERPTPWNVGVSGADRLQIQAVKDRGARDRINRNAPCEVCNYRKYNSYTDSNCQASRPTEFPR